MSFVKLSIFGTSFEVHLPIRVLSHADLPLFQVTTRYVDLQPVGMGRFCYLLPFRNPISVFILQVLSVSFGGLNTLLSLPPPSLLRRF